MEEYNEQPYPDSDFDILPNPSQIDAELQNNNPDSTQSQDPINESQPMTDSQDDPSQLVPIIYQTPEQDYDLPIQEDGTVDLDLLKLTWRTYHPSTPTFHHWCMNQRIPSQMIKNKQRFSDNLKFLQLKSHTFLTSAAANPVPSANRRKSGHAFQQPKLSGVHGAFGSLWRSVPLPRPLPGK